MKIAAQVGDRVHQVEIAAVDGRYRVNVDGVVHDVDAVEIGEGAYTVLNERGRSYEVSVEARRDGYLVRHRATEMRVILTDPSRRAREAGAAKAGPQQVLSQMPGKVVRVLVSAGDAVEAGQGLVVIEAMKMENEIAAPKAGRIVSIAVEAGQTIAGGGLLLVID